jgi:hypothetical protein
MSLTILTGQITLFAPKINALRGKGLHAHTATAYPAAPS